MDQLQIIVKRAGPVIAYAALYKNPTFYLLSQTPYFIHIWAQWPKSRGRWALHVNTSKELSTLVLFCLTKQKAFKILYKASSNVKQ